MLPARVACLALAGLVAGAGCWMSVPVMESSAGVVPAVIAPESDAAVAVIDGDDEPLDEFDGDPSLPAEATPQLEVEAELVEARSAPHCGRAKYVVVMRYAIRRVIAGSYPERELFVALQCPELGLPACRGRPNAPVRHFRAGEVHRMKLSRGTGGGAVVDKFTEGPAAELPRYRARCGEAVGPG